MNDQQTQTLSLVAAYAFGKERGCGSEVTKIRDMVIEWDSGYTSSLRRGYIVELFERLGIFEEFKRLHWSFGDTPPGETRRRRFLRIKSQYEEYVAGRAPELSDTETEDREPDSVEALTFALEAHLRDFLSLHLDRIESGLRLHSQADRSGVEFPVDGGRIDLLAIDRDGKFVVIELKLSHGRNKALGQLLYYMGWVDQHIGNGPCRGLIIASEITDELSVAVARAPGVGLARYSMDFSIERIAPGVGSVCQTTN